MLTAVILVVGAVIVGVIAFSQLAGNAGGSLRAPGDPYPAGLVDGQNLGRPDAVVTMEVYEDYQCPVCARFSLSVEPILVSRYVTPGTLRIVHHDIAILGRGGASDESLLPAKGAVCATNQGAYWAYAHWIYNNQDGENRGGFRYDRVVAIAEAAGLDRAAFETCMADQATTESVARSTTAATALGINSTPTMYIGDQQIVGLRTPDELGALIDAAAAASPAP